MPAGPTTILLYLVLFAVVLCIDIFCAKSFAEAARDKGYTDRKYFWLCLLLPPVGYLLVIALPDRGDE